MCHKYIQTNNLLLHYGLPLQIKTEVNGEDVKPSLSKSSSPAPAASCAKSSAPTTPLHNEGISRARLSGGFWERLLRLHNLRGR